MDAATLDAIERELADLYVDGSEAATNRARELVEFLEAEVAKSHDLQATDVEAKLETLFDTNPWMAPDLLARDFEKIARANGSLRSKRRKVIAISQRINAALEPHVACRPGCSQCCHMNTMIYEHEAARLAEVTGRRMTRLPYRPRYVVIADGRKFNGRPCPFLVQNHCSVYEDRPLVCRVHHSLRDTAELCDMSIPEDRQVRAPMYEPDLLEIPYMELSATYNPREPCGNIAEFFPD